MDVQLYRLLERQSYLNEKNNVLFQLLSGKNKSNKSVMRMDTFEKSRDMSCITNTYSAIRRKKKEYLSEDILHTINNDCFLIQKHGNVYEGNGIRFTEDQIPELDRSSFPEVKAENNVMDFGGRNYFKYVSSDGKEHYLYARSKGTIGLSMLDCARGVEYDKQLGRYAYFWNYLMGDTTYLGLNYSQEEKKEYLQEAGIQPGFFTVKMGEKEAVKFYSTGEYSVTIYDKERYDAEYRSLTQGRGVFSSYEPGCVFKFGGNEYTLKEDHTFDIPYGEDIFNISAPVNYEFGRKVY